MAVGREQSRKLQFTESGVSLFRGAAASYCTEGKLLNYMITVWSADENKMAAGSQ